MFTCHLFPGILIQRPKRQFSPPPSERLDPLLLQYICMYRWFINQVFSAGDCLKCTLADYSTLYNMYISSDISSKQSCEKTEMQRGKKRPHWWLHKKYTTSSSDSYSINYFIELNKLFISFIKQKRTIYQLYLQKSPNFKIFSWQWSRTCYHPNSVLLLI